MMRIKTSYILDRHTVSRSSISTGGLYLGAAASPVQERPELLEEQRPGRLLLEHQMIRARQ
jgi:hypothetical protein